MRIFAYELKKLISYRAFLLIVGFSLVISIFSEIYNIHNDIISPRDYRQITKNIANMGYDEAMEYLNNQIELSFEEKSDYNINTVYYSMQQLRRISAYEGYLDSINEQCKKILQFSVFSNKGSFAYKNSLKTYDAYNSIKIKKLPFDVSKGIENVLFSNISDILLLFLVFSVAVFIFIKDKEIGITNLLNACPYGRLRLCLCKLSVMFVVTLILELVFTIVLVIINGISYGFGDLSRPIQSVNSFIECPYNFNIPQYIILNLFIKWLGYGTFSMLFSCICICSVNSIQIYIISFSVSAVEFLLYTKVSRVTDLGLLHDFNLISFIRPDNMLSVYRNLNVSGLAINASVAIVTFQAVVFILFVSISGIFFCTRNQEYKKIALCCKISHKQKIHSKIYYSFQKSIAIQGSFAIICVWAIVVALFHINFTKPASIVDFYYKKYTEQCQGTITSYTDEFISTEENYFNELEEKMRSGMLMINEQNNYQTEQLKKEAFIQFKMRVETIKDRKETEIFYDTGYIRAFGIDEKKETYQLYLLMLVVCVLTISPIISYDKSCGITSIIYSTATGKRKYLYRCILIAFVYSITAAISVMLPYFLNILRKYGTQGISVSIQSIAEVNLSWLSLSIWQYVLCLFIIRTVVLIICSFMMLIVSYNSKSRFNATLLNLAVFIMPLIILML